MAFISRLILYTPTTFGRYLLDYTIIDVSHSTPLSTHYSNPPLQHCLPKFFLHYSSSMINAGLIAARQLGQRQNSRITVYSQQMITTTGQKKKTCTFLHTWYSWNSAFRPHSIYSLTRGHHPKRKDLEVVYEKGTAEFLLRRGPETSSSW